VSIRSELVEEEHTWAEIATTENIRVGLSNHLCTCKGLKKLAPNVHTLAIGEKIGQLEPFGDVLTRFNHIDLYAPVSGRLKRLNRKVLGKPWIISEDPYEMGWITEIESTNLEDEIKGLLDFKQYLLACMEQCIECPKKNCLQVRRLDEWV
jgi:glycine cleavage system H protein